MSISSLTGTTHAAFSTRPATTSASDELQSLFARLHMDAIASMSDTSSTATSTGTTANGATTATDGVTGLVHGLRSLLDGGVAVAKDARSVAKAYSGAGAGALATQVLSKLG